MGPGMPGLGPNNPLSPTTRAALAGKADPTAWQIWWAFNQGRYLKLGEYVNRLGTLSSDGTLREDGTLASVQEIVTAKIQPALLDALQIGGDATLVNSLIVALAKLGDPDDAEQSKRFEFTMNFLLKSEHETIAETAAVSYGILASEGSVDVLTTVLAGGEEAEALLDTEEVGYRTRAFCAYALGLIGQRSTNSALKQRVVEALSTARSGRTRTCTPRSGTARSCRPRPPAPGAGLPPRFEALAPVLARRGIATLYAHQTRALELLEAGRDVVLATPTASGKSLVYNLPVLQRAREDAAAHALYLFPLKALGQDQRQRLEADVADLGPGGRGTRVAIYDGDTPTAARRRIRRDPPAVLITTPDMLHAGILPHHASWAAFFRGLRTVVIDELHSYRGIFGSTWPRCCAASTAWPASTARVPSWWPHPPRWRTPESSPPASPGAPSRSSRPTARRALGASSCSSSPRPPPTPWRRACSGSRWAWGCAPSRSRRRG